MRNKNAKVELCGGWRSDRRRQCAAADQHTVRGEGISHPVGRQVASRSSARRLEVFQFEKMSLMSPTSSGVFGLEFLSLVFRSLFRSIRIWLGFEESKNYPPRRRLVAGVLSLGINGHPRTFLSMNQIK